MRYLLPLLLFIAPLKAADWDPEKKLITASAFSSYATHHYNWDKAPLAPLDVKPNDLIFVNPDCLESFFRRVHPRIRASYILITHGRQDAVPGRFAPYLDDPKIKAWFGVHLDAKHPKLKMIPYGLFETLEPGFDEASFIQASKAVSQRNRLVCVVVGPKPLTSEEKSLLADFSKKSSFITVTSAFQNPKLYGLIKQAYFFLPLGFENANNPLTWQAFYLGAIPIIRDDSEDELFSQLRVLKAADSSLFTEKKLRKEHERLSSQSPELSRLAYPYWLKKIQTERETL